MRADFGSCCSFVVLVACWSTSLLTCLRRSSSFLVEDRWVILLSLAVFGCTGIALVLPTYRSILARCTVVCTLLAFFRFYVDIELLMREEAWLYEVEDSLTFSWDFCALMKREACFCNWLILKALEEPSLFLTSVWLFVPLARRSLGCIIIEACLLRLLLPVALSTPAVSDLRSSFKELYFGLLVDEVLILCA